MTISHSNPTPTQPTINTDALGGFFWRVMMLVDPRDTENHDKPLWAVYGPECFPSVLLCKIKDCTTGGYVIWGYSVWKKVPGFRTLGLRLNEWEAREGSGKVQFFDTQAEAFDLLAKLTTPAKGAT